MRNFKYLFCLCVAVMCMNIGFAQTKSAGQVTAPARNAVPNIVTKPAETNGPHLGRYELYSGIPTIYIGNVVLLANGKYKVAFSTAEDDYEIGRYTFHADTNTIEWLSGMFKNNNWRGKLTTTEKGYRIEFNSATYADSNNSN